MTAEVGAHFYQRTGLQVASQMAPAALLIAFLTAATTRMLGATVSVSPASGFFRQPVAVTMTSSAPGEIIHFTLDGSDPSTNSSVYSAPVLLNASMQLRAASFAGAAAGPITNAVFTISTSAPNVLLLIAEDVGVGDLHHYGNPVHATPNFDALGRTGLRFTQTYCTGPSNAPNQYATLTGRLLPRSGLPPFIAPGSTNGIAAREWTLGEAFLKAGYRTAFIGGWHLGDRATSLPHAQGFELFYGLAMPLEGTTLANLHENNTVVDVSPNATNLLDQFVTRGLAFLDANATNRFMVALQVPPLPATGTSLGGPYGNSIEAVDNALGQLVSKLDQLGVRNQTLIVFASDEGPDLTTPLPRGSAGMFRDGRSTTFEGGVRIPAYANWPGTIIPGAVSEAIWWLPDLPSTLCAIAGLPWPTNRPMDGLNRADALTGAALRPTGTEQLYFHRLTNSAPNLAAQRLGPVKYHRNLTKTDPENSYTTANLPMLFNLELDPSERFPGFITSLTNSLSALDAAAATHLATFQPPYPQLPPQSSLISSFSILSSSGHEPPLRLRFIRAPDTLDGYYAVEQSLDLLNWISTPLTSLERQVNVLPDGTEEVIFTPLSPAPGTNRVFYRLRATLP